MPLLSDPPPMGSGGSPNQASIIFNVEEIIKRGVNANHLADLFQNTKSITGLWNFSTSPTFGTSNGFLKATAGVLSFETLADVATSNDYNDLDNLPSLATVATSGGYSDLTGKPTIPATLTDLGSPTTAFNFGNQELRNLNKVILGVNTTSDYNLDISNCIYTANLLGTDKSSVKMMGTYTTDYFNTIDAYYHTSATVPSAKAGFQFTGGGSFFCVATSNNYGLGPTHFNFASGFFSTENVNAIKLAESLLFTTNNTGSIGTSSIAPANIYAVNALNVTSDNEEKKDIDKNLPLGLDFIRLVSKNAIATYSWKDTVIPEKKSINFKKIEKINEVTNEKNIDYELETIILEKEKIETHSRKKFGFLGEELYKCIIDSGLDTQKCGFLSVYDEDQIYRDAKNAITGEIIENKNKKPFEVKLTKKGRPKGKITVQPTEMLPILFKAIDQQAEQIEALQAQIKILLEK